MRTPRDFRRVLKRGRRKQVGGLVLIAAKGPNGSARVGFIVSRSVGNAVARNRARRRLRHTVQDVTLQPGMDYVIIAHDSVVDAPYPSLKGWLERALSELEGQREGTESA